MATLPSIRRISREDLKEAPGWIEQLLGPLNLFMGSVYQALSGDITFRQNIRCTIKELRFTTLATYTVGEFTEIVFPTGLGGVKADGVEILQINEVSLLEPVILGAPVPNWIERNGDIHVRYISGLSDSKIYGVRFRVT